MGGACASWRVVDDYARECLALVADTSISGIRVARELDKIVAVHGRPAGIVSDNGTELTSTAILVWSIGKTSAWHYIAPGKPVQNAFIKSFNGRLKPCSRIIMRLKLPSAFSGVYGSASKASKEPNSFRLPLGSYSNAAEQSCIRAPLRTCPL